MRYLILSVPLSLLVSKDIFKYYVFGRHLYVLCILAVGVMSRRILALVVILKFEMK